MVFCALVFFAALALRAALPKRGISVGVFARELSDGGLEGAIAALGRAAAGRASGEDIIAALLSGDETETGKQKGGDAQNENRYSDWREVPLPAGYSFRELE